MYDVTEWVYVEGVSSVGGTGRNMETMCTSSAGVDEWFPRYIINNQK